MPLTRRALGAAAAAASLVVLLPAATAAAAGGPSNAAGGPAAPPPQSKIVQGAESAPGAWPAQASVLRAGERRGFLAQYCGGTLVAPRWVLTAAHCVWRPVRGPDGETITGYRLLDPAEVHTAVGVTSLDEADLTVEQASRGEQDPGRRSSIARVVVHPDYDPARFPADLALLELATPRPEPVQPLLVPGQEPLAAPGVVGRIVGRGSTSSDVNDPVYPRTLQEAPLPVISDADCRRRVGDELVADVMLCAGLGTYAVEAVDTCFGDSGGPLLVPSPRGLRQAGVTSFGQTCGNSPTAYVELSVFAPWVESVTGADLNTFSDTGGSPHETSVERAAALGVAGGTTAGTFRPGDVITREQTASLVARAAGVVPTAEDAQGGFPDVDATHRASVNALVRLGVVQGRADGTFRPRDPVTRAQVASLLARALGLPPAPGRVFPDVDPTSTHAGAVAALAPTGVVNGYKDGTFRPAADVTRGQVASFVSRSFLADGAVGPPPSGGPTAVPLG